QVVVEVGRAGRRGGRIRLDAKRTTFELFFLQEGFELLAQSPGDVGVLTGVFGYLGGGHLVHRQLLVAFADQIRDGDNLVAQMFVSKNLDVMTPLAEVQQIIDQHGVAGDSSEQDSMLPEDLLVVPNVLLDLSY